MLVDVRINWKGSNADLQKWIDSIGGIGWSIPDVPVSLDLKRIDILAGWHKLGPMHPETIRDNWRPVNDTAGLYVFAVKGCVNHPLEKPCLYIGESATSMYKRIYNFIAAWRGKKTNHGSRIHEWVIETQAKHPNVAMESFEIWYRTHDTDDPRTWDKDNSRQREGLAFAMHKILHKVYPALNVRDLHEGSHYEQHLRQKYNLPNSLTGVLDWHT